MSGSQPTRQMDQVAFPKPISSRAPQPLDPIAVGDENLRLWCIRNPDALRMALIFEGLKSEIANGVCTLVWLLYKLAEERGRPEITIAIDGKRGLQIQLGKDADTVRAWIDAAVEWGLVCEDRGRGRPSKLRIDWPPILLRIRNAAIGGAISDVPLFQPTASKVPESLGNFHASGQEVPESLGNFQTFGQEVPTGGLGGLRAQHALTSKEEKDFSSLLNGAREQRIEVPLSRPPKVPESLGNFGEQLVLEFDRLDKTNVDGHRQTHARLDQLPRDVADQVVNRIAELLPQLQSRDRPAQVSPYQGPEWTETRRLYYAAGCNTWDACVLAAAGRGWTPDSMNLELRRIDRLRAEAAGERPFDPGLVNRHFGTRDAGTQIDGKLFRKEYRAARERIAAGKSKVTGSHEQARAEARDENAKREREAAEAEYDRLDDSRKAEIVSAVCSKSPFNQKLLRKSPADFLRVCVNEFTARKAAGNANPNQPGEQF